jgi:hypothetical protein
VRRHLLIGLRFLWSEHNDFILSLLQHSFECPKWLLEFGEFRRGRRLLATECRQTREDTQWNTINSKSVNMCWLSKGRCGMAYGGDFEATFPVAATPRDWQYQFTRSIACCRPGVREDLPRSAALSRQAKTFLRRPTTTVAVGQLQGGMMRAARLCRDLEKRSLTEQRWRGSLGLCRFVGGLLP